MLDNLPAHKVAGIRQIIASPRSRIFYLPPYSPDMNPIEMAFARPKALFRMMADRIEAFRADRGYDADAIR